MVLKNKGRSKNSDTIRESLPMQFLTSGMTFTDLYLGIFRNSVILSSNSSRILSAFSLFAAATLSFFARSTLAVGASAGFCVHHYPKHNSTTFLISGTNVSVKVSLIFSTSSIFISSFANTSSG